MGIELYLSKIIESRERCVFCDFALEDIGKKDKNGAVKIYESGKDPEKDWFGILQSSVSSDPKTGFRILLLPIGHLTAFLSEDMGLMSNYGVATFKLSMAMQQIRTEENPQLFIPSQIIYGKCLTQENTLEHLHIKLDEFSGGLAQAFPPDAGWIGKTKYEYGVQAKVVTQEKLEEDRIDSLAERLIKYAMR